MKKRMVGAGLLMGLVAGSGAGLVLQASGLAGAAGSTGAGAPVVQASGAIAPLHHGVPHGDRGARHEAAAAALGMTAEELRTALSSGSTLAEVATAQGVSVQTVIDALVAEAKTHLDTKVADGTITADQAAAKLAEATTRITDMVNNGRPEREGGRRERRPSLDAAVTALGMTAEELRTALSSGSTLAEVATAQGVPVQTVIDALVAEVQTKLDARVADGSLTADEAAAKLTEATTRITDMVNNGAPVRPADGNGPRGRRDGRRGELRDGRPAPADATLEGARTTA